MVGAVRIRIQASSCRSAAVGEMTQRTAKGRATPPGNWSAGPIVFAPGEWLRGREVRVFTSIASWARRTAPAAAAMLAAVLLAGCSTSSSGLVNLWKDPQYSSGPMKSVLVVAIRNDAVTRRLWEDGLVAELRHRGAAAEPSYNLFPNAPPDTSQIAEAMVAHGFDGVLETHRLATVTGERYVPGYATTQPITYYNRWSQMYETYYREVYQPGHTETERIVRYQVNLFSAGAGGRLVWSGTTETVDPSSTQDTNRAISKLIVPEMTRTGLIAGR